MVKVGTGQKHLLGLREKKAWVDSGTYEVDAIFRQRIGDYYGACARFLKLLEQAARMLGNGVDDAASGD